jgi:SAM-dependent methyltransferase
VSEREQYARQADDWTDRAYADVAAYLSHRAQVVATLGLPLEPGDEVLDLACGDGGLGEALLERRLRYRGVDSTPEMVEAAHRRLGGRAPVDLGDLNEYAPPEPVAATTMFRAIYYARDRRAFFGHAGGYTQKKLVFDRNPRQYRLDDVLADLRAVGLTSISLRPFFVPQTVSLPGPAVSLAKALERTGPLARLALRVRFTYLVAAARR